MIVWIVLTHGLSRTVAGIYYEKEIAESRREQLVNLGHRESNIDIETYEMNTDYGIIS